MIVSRTVAGTRPGLGTAAISVLAGLVAAFLPSLQPQMAGEDVVPEGRSSAFTTLISTFFLLRLSSLSAL